MRVSSLILFVSLPVHAQVHGPLLDAFDDLSGWHGVTSHGAASKIAIRPAAGHPGNAMLMDFSFLGHMGSAAAEKKFSVPLPANYRISFDVRGECPVNNFVIRLMDSLDNVWWVNRSNFDFPRTWTRMTIRKSQIQYGWGPSGGGDLKTLDRIMLMIDVVEGGKGKIWIDNLAIEPLDEGAGEPLRVSASSSAAGHAPGTDTRGTAVTGWRSSGKNDEWLEVDFGYVKDLGGLVIDWEPGRGAGGFDVLLSDDGKGWRTAYAANNSGGMKSYVYMSDEAARFVRLELKKNPGGRNFGIRRLELKGPEFGFSVNEFFRGVASGAPRGDYPEYLYGEQSYWTIVGAPGDSRKALVNEQGMIETDKLSCSLEPFLSMGGGLLTWNDASLTQTLDRDYLPIPSIRWQTKDSVSLTTTALAAGEPGGSSLLVRYTLENRSARRRDGKLFVAMRPFQVNPPWQTFTIVGGAARIDTISYDGVVHCNGVAVVPLTRPAAFGAAEFDAGQITEYLRRGTVPAAQTVRDHFGYASAALQYDFDLPPGGIAHVVLAVPYHGLRSRLPAGLPDAAAAAWFERMRARTGAEWDTLLGGVSISLPGEARAIVNTVKSNLAYILMTADGPALQPGARSYQRSWVRDGSLTSAALLQMEIDGPVRRYIDWYSGYQYPDGRIPAVVESRGPEPTPENDSHGEFISMIREYFSFSRDTAWLRGKWESVRKTARYIHALREERKTGLYRNGTPEQRACFGLVPESISHEGYCPAPMHSYWDDFFALRGLNDAAFIARVLGENAQAVAILAESDDFGADLLASLRQAIRNRNIRFIPGCAELGDFSGLSTTVAVTPCEVLGSLPPEETRYTFDESYRMFLARKNNTIAWDSYLPYEARFIGTYVLLDEKERAEDILDYLMHDRRPSAWNEWAEVVWKDYRAGKSIGDMPHSWAASDFIRSFRTMLAYERERDSSLVLCAGIPDSWVRDPRGITVKNLPTHFGPLGYSVRAGGNRVVVEVDAGMDIPPGNIHVRSPLSGAPREIRGARREDGDPRDAVVESLPARIIFTY